MKHSHSPTVIFAPQGDLVRMTFRSSVRRKASAVAPRGEIQSFSRRSRSRLMMKLAQVKRHALPLFVTLTYPASFPELYQEYKYDLRSFFDALHYHFPAFGAVWKLEYQSRGAAHFHILLWGVDLERALTLIPKLWHKIAGQGDYNHYLWHIGELPGTSPCVQAIRSWNGVRSYASKYFTKLDETKNKTGRFWGVRGLVPFSGLLKLKICMQTALDFRRSFNRAKSFSVHRLGFWSFGYSPDWLLYVDYLENKNNSGFSPEHPPWLYSPAPPPERDISFF